MRRADNLHVPIVLKSGSLNLLEPSGPVMGLLYKTSDKDTRGRIGESDFNFQKHNSVKSTYRVFKSGRCRPKYKGKGLPRTGHESPEGK